MKTSTMIAMVAITILALAEIIEGSYTLYTKGFEISTTISLALYVTSIAFSAKWFYLIRKGEL